jgi:hypothetical protein
LTTNLTVQEEIKAFEKKKVKSAWINSAKTWEESDDGQLVRPRTIFFGERPSGNLSQGGFAPTWEDPAYDLNLAVQGREAIKQGSTDLGKLNIDPYIGKWQNIAHEYNDAIKTAIKSGSKTALKQAGIGMAADFSAIDVINVSAQLLGTELRDFVLEQAVTEIAVPQLTVSIDTYTRFLAQQGIGEGVEPITKLGAIARSTYDLPKDGGAVALTFEAQTRASHDLMRIHIDNLVSDLRRIKSANIATEIETATDVSGEDVGANSGGLSTNKPDEKIGTVTDTITANNGNPNTIATHDKVFREYISNTWVTKFATSSPQTDTLSNAKVITNIPGLPGFTWYIDNSKTATILSIYDKAAIVKFQGPIRTAVVRMDMPDVDAFRVFDFNLPKLIQTSKARDLTGATA